MEISRLVLKDFRNFTSCTYVPSRDVNVICGDNALGKTNLLEAIWLFTGCKSFRGARDRSLVRFGAEYARNEVSFSAGKREQTAVMLIDKKRTAALNGIKLESTTGLFGNFPAVVFAPNHLSLVKGAPAERRRFLDTALCMLKPSYAKTLSDYNRVLAQRNMLLKDRRNPYFSDMLSAIDVKMSACSRAVADVRYAFVDELLCSASAVYGGISDNREKLNLRYVSVLPEDFGGGTYEEMFAVARDEDVEAGFTKYGPHRDDIEIILDDRSARLYGSQGQQRSCALSLKLAEAEMIEKKFGEKPVILLDDVMSELDAGRQDYILNRLTGTQVFITCCEPGTVLRMKCGESVAVTDLYGT